LFKREVGRNDLCPCGSGRKFKRCHGNPLELKKLPEQPTLFERNLALISAADDVFGFSSGRTWANLRKTLSAAEVRSFYVRNRICKRLAKAAHR
jgi:hypothetical protein